MSRADVMTRRVTAKPVPRGAITPATTHIFMLVLAGRRTYGPLMTASGLCRSGVRHHLVVLRDAGLVTWEPEKNGTLRALVGPVAS